VTVSLIAFGLMLSAINVPDDIIAYANEDDDDDDEDDDNGKNGKINDCEEFDPEGVDFHLEEATIADVHEAILAGEITSLQLVCLYFDRILEYGNDQCVDYVDDDFLGDLILREDAEETNAYQTVNLRPDARANLGFDDLKTRSTTDLEDNDENMPDALEVAAALDAEFAKTGVLSGPLHGIPIAVKDQMDTFDMRTTSAADAFYDNDRPPDDSAVAASLREAGAIIIGKAQTGEYARDSRSSFGGQTCNPYDTTRNPSGSSAGSGVVPAANLAMCAIAEDSGGSIRGPASVNNNAGLRPTYGLISTDGLFFATTTRDTLGPICRTVLDTAIVTDVLKGFDPEDPRTALSLGRIPSESFASHAEETSLDGIRIGVVKEIMVAQTQQDDETLRVLDEAIDDLEDLGAEIVEITLKDYIADHFPRLHPGFLLTNFPEIYDIGVPIDIMLEHEFDPSLVPVDDFVVFGEFALLSPGTGDGETRYGMNFYLEQRGDKDIDTIGTIIEEGNSVSYTPERLIAFNEPTTYDNTEASVRRAAIQEILLIIMAENNLDAFVYQSRDLPVTVLGAPFLPPGTAQLVLSPLSPITGFPALIVPMGFSEEAFDFERENGDLVLKGPFDVQMPMGMEILGKPFDESTLFKIGSAYEAATNHRTPPADFPPLAGEP